MRPTRIRHPRHRLAATLPQRARTVPRVRRRDRRQQRRFTKRVSRWAAQKLNEGTITMDGFDIELRSSGSGWMGAFVLALQTAVADILSDRSTWSPAEVTLYDGTVYAGTLSEWMGESTLKIDDYLIEVDDVVRFRA